MRKVKILLAEDDSLTRDNLAEFLSENGCNITAVADGREAMEAFSSDKYDIVITDLKMPHADGMEVLTFVKDSNPDAIVVIMTGYATVKSAVDAMRAGAFDYITKPLKEDLVKLTIQRAVSFAQLQEENIALKDHLKEKYDFGKMVGYSARMKKVFETIEKVASTDSTVIVYGESGTGKELVAKAIHFNSDRKAQPLVTVNCGAIPEDLLESELFGHEKGAFTGAIRNRIGRFELAQGGTIFLDEIGDMSPSLQVKVLRVIQERQFERIGGMKTLDADVRIIAATNKDLEKAVAENQFREDLYYRINVIPITLPPLRVRKEDLPVLIGDFLTMFNKQKRRNVQGLTSDAMACMLNYSWPGNVRELQNIMEMLVVIKGEGYIEIEDLPEKVRSHSMKTDNSMNSIEITEEGLNLNYLLSKIERDLLKKALEKSGGIKNKAAKLLNLNRTTLVEKLKRYDMG